jgi:hypothetical protein
MPATTAPSGFSDEEAVRLIETLEGADGAELELTVSDANRRSTLFRPELGRRRAEKA